MNISKVLLASIMFPIVYFRNVLNAITIPIFIFTCNWVLGAKFGNDYAFLTWFSYLFQFYALSLLLTNCILLVTKKEVPKFFEKQSVYFKCTLLLVGYSIVVFIGKHLLVVLGINVFNLAQSDNFAQVDEIAGFVSSIISFSLFFVIPHYVYSGKISARYVLDHIRKYFISLTLIILIIEIIKAAIGYMFIDATAMPIIVLGLITQLVLKAFGYIIISFCYIAIFSKKTSLNIEV